MKLAITNPPAGAQLSKKTPPLILHADATMRIVESNGGYPVAIGPTSDEILTTGYLSTAANATKLSNALRAFIEKNPAADKYKRWGEVLSAFVSQTKTPYTHLVPYAPLRQILLSLTVQAAPVPTNEREKEIATTTTAPPTTPKKRATPISNIVKKRIKLRDATSYADLAHVPHDEWLLAIAIAQQAPDTFASQYAFAHNAARLCKGVWDESSALAGK